MSAYPRAVNPESTPDGTHNGAGSGRSTNERLTAVETKLEYTATKEDVQEIKTVIAEKHTDTVTKMGDHHAAMLKVVIGVLSALSVGLLVAVVGWIAST